MAGLVDERYDGDMKVVVRCEATVDVVVNVKGCDSFKDAAEKGLKTFGHVFCDALVYRKDETGLLYKINNTSHPKVADINGKWKPAAE